MLQISESGHTFHIDFNSRICILLTGTTNSLIEFDHSVKCQPPKPMVLYTQYTQCQPEIMRNILQ